MKRKPMSDATKAKISATMKARHAQLKPLPLQDGLVNIVANLGTSKDKRAQSQFASRLLYRDELEIMYDSDWIAGKVVDIPVDDMTRNWRRLKSNEAPQEDLEIVETLERDLQIKDKINEALKWARLYGGSLILLGIDGAGPVSTPLDPNRVGLGSLKYLHVLDRYDVQIDALNTTEPHKSNFRQAEYYTVNGAPNTKIHFSRVLRFDGIKLPWRKRQANNYWGASILQRLYESILNAQTASDSAASMIYESSVDIVKMQNLFQYLSTPNGNDLLLERFALANQSKSFNNMLLLDKDQEEHARVFNNFSGLADLIIKYLNVAAAAADIPATRLLGQSAPGLNATGESDTENYYNMLSSTQETRLGPQLRQLDQVLVRSALGYYPEDFGFEFNALWLLSDSAKADIDIKNAQRDEYYLRNGVVTPSIVAYQLRENGVYNSLTEQFISDLEAIELEPKDEGMVLEEHGVDNETASDQDATTETEAN